MSHGLIFAAAIALVLKVSHDKRRHARALTAERETFDSQLEAYLDWRHNAARRS